MKVLEYIGIAIAILAAAALVLYVGAVIINFLFHPNR